VNVHGSLLPRYRGAAPIQWAVIRGEPETGVTMMRMDMGLLVPAAVLEEGQEALVGHVDVELAGDFPGGVHGQESHAAVHHEHAVAGHEVGDGPAAALWSDEDRTLLRAVDQLCERTQIDDETWAALASRFDRRQLMDLVFTIGHYVMLAMALSAFGVEVEEAFRSPETALAN